jgi:hypothetical protein
MQETNGPKASIWKRPLKGWRALAGWLGVVIATPVLRVNAMILLLGPQ